MTRAPAAQTNPRRKRSPCPIACALDLLGDRWSLLVVRDVMLFGRHTFGELLASPEGIATNILTTRLRRLVADGILERRLYQAHPPRYSYHLTERGAALRPLLKAVARWGVEQIPDTLVPRP